MLIFVGDYQVDEVGPLVPLDGTQWRLTTIDNSAPLPGTEITLAFAINPDGETGKINGSSGCNTYQAAITEFFKLGAVTYANEICDTPEGIMDQENSYLDVLQNANGISMDGAGLTITSSVGILYFTSAGLAPVLPTPTPEALTAVIVAPGNEYLGKTITLDGSLSTPTGGITAYSWWFTGDEFAEGVTVQRTYDKPGAYDAILTVTDAHGGKADASIKVKIHHYLTGPVWVSDGGDITINFGDGTLSGFGGCNDYNASYSASTLVGATNEITVSSISATNKTCSDEIMNREQAFLNNLAAITTYKIDINRISLSNKDGQVIFTGYAASQ